MPVLSDKWIKKTVKTKGMIKPFVNKQVRKGKISFGLSSYGYDARVSNEFKIFTNVNSGVVDPKVFKKESFVTKLSFLKTFGSTIPELTFVNILNSFETLASYP